MTVYRFPTEGLARRFTRNARGRGYTVKVAGCLARVDRADAQLRLLAQRYVGHRMSDAKPTTD